jgi:hypothetical protein
LGLPAEATGIKPGGPNLFRSWVVFPYGLFPTKNPSKGLPQNVDDVSGDFEKQRIFLLRVIPQ